MNPQETVLRYLGNLRDIRASGAGMKETSYYGALEALLNEVGKTLKPRVRCVLQLQNKGAGIPDGGLFVAQQFQKADAAEPLPGQTPERGVLEVKGAGDDIDKIAAGEQIARYLNQYGQVLVTNYRDFALIGKDAGGAAVIGERYRLAESEAGFWSAPAAEMAAAHGARLTEYLQRVMLRKASLAAPEEVAWFLASYAREVKSRIEAASQQTAFAQTLAAVRGALEESLGISFEGEKGDRFFRSTFVQTLFYGIFTAWALWSKQRAHAPTPCPFDWRSAHWQLRVPALESLFEQVVMPTRLRPLGLEDVLDWMGDALNRVDRAAFFERFETGNAIQYFYEPFLEAFDPELRRELGVWYTPVEIVQYMAARVDTALREELNIEDGLADPRVYVLDPCCGTGAYLTEVLKRIAATLDAKGGDALLAQDLKRAAQERVFGFEILPAPYVVAHLQLGLLLQNLGAPLSHARNERVGVYLTNALTGWEPPTQALKERIAQLALSFPGFKAEHDAADEVKRDKPILVVLGNPPYSGYAGVAIGEERELSEAYRTTEKAPKPQGQGLNELYVRFFRMAERQIAERRGAGIVCFISNYSWLDGLSHPGMRERYLEVFDTIQIDCLNGDKYRTGKRTPEGAPDPSVFSSEWNREGIQVGTAIALLVRKEPHAGTEAVQFRHLWGKTKRAQLLETMDAPPETLYQPVTPVLELGLPFMPLAAESDYLDWPLLPELFPKYFPGVQTKRDELVVDIDRDQLEARMRAYFDPNVSHEEMRRICSRAIEDTKQFDARAIRTRLINRGFLPRYVVRHCYRPFDMRWLYWEPEEALLSRRVPDYLPQVFTGNVWIVTQQKSRGEWSRPQFIRSLGCLDLMDRSASCFPLLLRPNGQMALTDDANGEPQPNLSKTAQDYLASLGAADEAESLFYHALAVLHAPAYRAENAGALRQDWPRVPLPRSLDALRASAALGRQVAALLDAETPVPGVTAGAIRPELQSVAPIRRADGGQIDPAAGDLDVTAGWGHAGADGAVMPAKGRWATGEGHWGDGEVVYDVYLNERTYWAGVPARVWKYTLGGYPVMKKWLSYREKPLLGRGLTTDEAREVTQMARRIAALLLLEPELDANYAAAKAS